LLVGFVSVMLIWNDVGEYVWGWPDQEFGVDNIIAEHMSLNVDLTVAMPCHCKPIYVPINKNETNGTAPL
jgi:endoplasmic reticulum-Golgi intermediate compartment protein 2